MNSHKRTQTNFRRTNVNIYRRNFNCSGHPVQHRNIKLLESHCNYFKQNLDARVAWTLVLFSPNNGKDSRIYRSLVCLGHVIQWRCKGATGYAARRRKHERRRDVGEFTSVARIRGWIIGRWIFLSCKSGGDASREIKSQYRSWIYEKVMGNCLRRDTPDKTLWTANKLSGVSNDVHSVGFHRKLSIDLIRV